MKPRYPILLTILLLLFASGAGFAAEEKNPISIISDALVEIQVVNAKGEKEMKRVPADKVMPGTVVIFVNTVTNNGSQPAENVTVHNAVPEHMHYLDGSASGAGTAITFSVDGGKTYDRPEKLTVTGKDGKPRPAGPDDYTNIRWQFTRPLQPKESAPVEFRARLE